MPTFGGEKYIISALRQEVKTHVKGELMDEIQRLGARNEELEAEVSSLEERNNLKDEVILKAAEHIKKLEAQLAVPNRTDLLKHLGVSDPNDPRREEAGKALRIVMGLLHPDKHQDKSTMVTQVLGYLTHPVTSALTRLRRPGVF